MSKKGIFFNKKKYINKERCFLLDRILARKNHKK